ncbi:MAG TPA: hypothetical protein VHI11_03660 [Jiangellaceae bacterium]|nr:hypothetical protein [Jiangellaceae bacterium]
MVLLAATACAGTGTATESPNTEPAAVDSPSTEPAADAGRYDSRRFQPPFEVTVPAWLPLAPSADEQNFLTFIGEDESFDRAVRFLVPVNLYEPGSDTATGPPDDYVEYLHGQSANGARLTDETTTAVDGMATTIMTASTSASLDGSLGCPAAGVSAPDCFGLQRGMTLRIAVIDMPDATLVAWARVTEGSVDTAEVFADFEQMLSSLRFR